MVRNNGKFGKQIKRKKGSSKSPSKKLKKEFIVEDGESTSVNSSIENVEEESDVSCSERSSLNEDSDGFGGNFFGLNSSILIVFSVIERI